MSKSIRDLPLMEQLAIEQALFSRLGEDVSTRNPDSLRSFADEELVSNYYSTGAKSYDQFVNGQKVGTYSVRVSRGTDEHTSTSLDVTDGFALEQFIESNCAEEAIEYAQTLSKNFAEYMLESYGILCEGCEVVEETIPAEPPKVLGTTLRIDAQKVGDALTGYLPTTIGGLLNGADS